MTMAKGCSRRSADKPASFVSRRKIMSTSNNNYNDLYDDDDNSDDGEIEEEDGEIVVTATTEPPIIAQRTSSSHPQPSLAAAAALLPPQDPKVAEPFEFQATLQQQQQSRPLVNVPPPAHAAPQQQPPGLSQRRNSWQGRGGFEGRGAGGGFEGRGGRGGFHARGAGGRLGYRRHSFGTLDATTHQRPNGGAPLPPSAAGRSQSLSVPVAPVPVLSMPTPQQLGQGAPVAAPAAHHRPTDPRFRGGGQPNPLLLSSGTAQNESQHQQPETSSYSNLADRSTSLERATSAQGSFHQAARLGGPPPQFGVNPFGAKDSAYPGATHSQNRRPSYNDGGLGTERSESYYGPSRGAAVSDRGMDGASSYYGPSATGNSQAQFPSPPDMARDPSSSSVGHYGPSGDDRAFMAGQDRPPFAGPPPLQASRAASPFGGQQGGRSFGTLKHPACEDDRALGTRPFGQLEKGLDPQQQQQQQQEPFSMIQGEGRPFGTQPNQQDRAFGPHQHMQQPPDRGFASRRPPFASDLSPRRKTQGFQQQQGGGFSRDRRDWTQRASPQSSPYGRKNILPVHQSQGQTIPLPSMEATGSNIQDTGIIGRLPGRFSDLPTPAPPTPAPFAQALPSQLPSPAAVAAAAAPPTVVPQSKLTTATLGDPSTIDRAESVIQALSELVGNFELKAPSVEDSHSELPSKQLLFQALAKMDTNVKALQQQITDEEVDLEDTDRMVEREVASAHEQAKQAAADKDNDLMQQEKMTRQSEEEKEEQGLDAKVRLAKSAFDANLSQDLAGLDKRIASSKQQEEERQAAATTAQVIAAADMFDKDITKGRRELERIAHATKKTDTKLASLETSYRATVAKDNERKESDDAASKKLPSLVSQVMAENKRRAAESHMKLAMLFGGPADHDADLANDTVKDPKAGLMNAEWEIKARQVTGLANALYSEPCEAPYYDAHERTHAYIGPLVKEYIRDKQNQLQARWSSLATEYEIRKTIHDEHMNNLNSGKAKQQRSSNIVRHSIFSKPGLPILESQGGRTSSNPYRRARRGNEVRSEYEQEQIIAELAAKEAYERKITHGGSELPRQVGQLERSLTATFYNTFEAQRVDMMEQEANLALQSVWSDMEKCIFLDRFMQHPKDFRKIAHFLRNKTTNDCVKFYYDSKPFVPYKTALKEFVMRRKKKESVPWDATIDAAISCGAAVVAGDSDEKPVVFLLPEAGHHATFSLHPLKREILDTLSVTDASAFALAGNNDSDDETPRSPGRPKRKQHQHTPLFQLDHEQRKFIKGPTQEKIRVSLSRGSLAETDVTGDSNSVEDVYDDKQEKSLTPLRRAPQKWTDDEKNIFVDTLAKHGRDWNRLAQAVGTKSTSQIKNFYYDYKKQSGRLRPEKDRKVQPDGRKRKREQDSDTPPQLQGGDFTEPDLPREHPLYDSSSQRYGQALPQQHVAHVADELLRQQREQQASSLLLSSNPSDDYSGSELWLQQLHQQQQQQQLGRQATDETTRQLLQRHTTQSHHRQQLLQNLLPWNPQSQRQQQAGGSLLDYLGGDSTPLSTAQQLQALLQIQQQQQQQHQQQQRQQHNPLAGAFGGGGGGHMGSLAGLAGITPSVLELALAQQQQQQQQHLQHQPQQLSADQLALQQLLGLGDNAETLALLQRALNNNRQN